MKPKVRYLTILFFGLAIALGMFWGCSKQSAENKTSDSSARPTISDAERALAMLQVQNSMSKHMYYHINGNHCEEMEDVWVSENGPYGKTATWSGASVEEGIALIKQNYCTKNVETKKKALTAISKVSNVKDVPENLGAGHEFSLHMQTTPIIEIAGDGKTAKGVWYTPGFIKKPNIADGKVTETGQWMFERYAVDFAKEDGKWKIWHFQNIGDTSPPWGSNAQPDQTQFRDSALDQAGAQAKAGAQNAQADSRTFTRVNPNPVPKVWSPTTVPEMYPKFPEPYYTFSETFSY